jgi:hypothetical protein
MPNSDVNNLVFGISADSSSDIKGKVHSIYVYRCADIYDRAGGGYYPETDKAVWIAETPLQKEKPYTNRIVYGQSQGNFETKQGAHPLEVPGCYTVLLYVDYEEMPRAATVGFNVKDDGSIIQMSDDEFKKLFSHSQ